MGFIGNMNLILYGELQTIWKPTAGEHNLRAVGVIDKARPYRGPGA
jgi:hypothetical protein